MNDLKTEKRNSLSPRLLDALIRIKLHEDTLETFDVNRFTSRYLQTHLRCDGQLHETRDSQTGTSSGLNNSGDSGIISIGEDEDEDEDYPDVCPSIESEARNAAQSDVGILNDHLYGRPVVTGPLDKRNPSDCIAIISKHTIGKGKALTVNGNEVVLQTFKGSENQQWYIYDEHFIASNSNGKVLQRTLFANEALSLAMFNPREDLQKWKINGHLVHLEYYINSFDQRFSMSNFGVEDGSIVGFSKKAKVPSQSWTIEKLDGFFPSSSNLPSTFAVGSDNSNQNQCENILTAEASTNDQRLIMRKPEDELFKIESSWESNCMTALSDEYMFVLEDSPTFADKLKWFKQGNHIVGHNGKVLEATGPNEPVTLNYYDKDEPLQKWIFLDLDDGHGTFEIVSFYENLKLDLIEDAMSSNVVRVGTLPPSDSEYHLTSKWKLRYIDSENGDD